MTRTALASTLAAALAALLAASGSAATRGGKDQLGAEAAPRAQHLPPHILTGAGYWKESIASNAEAARIAKAEKEPDDELHASDCVVYAYLQLGQYERAKEIIEEMKTVTGFNTERNTGPFALAASPARYEIERGDWKAAARLEVRPTKFAYVEAMTHFARALGAARSGGLESAKAEIAKLSELRDKLRQANEAYWANQVDIQLEAATAWTLYAEGRRAEALATMTRAADAEDKTEKGTVTPGPLAPARELLGAMLLQDGAYADALAAFEATLKKEPNRLNATAGAEKAAMMAGDAAKARSYRESLLKLTQGALMMRNLAMGPSR